MILSHQSFKVSLSNQEYDRIAVGQGDDKDSITPGNLDDDDRYDEMSALCKGDRSRAFLSQILNSCIRKGHLQSEQLNKMVLGGFKYKSNVRKFNTKNFPSKYSQGVRWCSDSFLAFHFNAGQV